MKTKLMSIILAVTFLLPTLFADTDVWITVASDEDVNFYINEANLNKMMMNTKSVLDSAKVALKSLPTRREFDKMLEKNIEEVEGIILNMAGEIYDRYDPMLQELGESDGNQWYILKAHEYMIFEEIVPMINELVKRILELEERDRYLEYKLSEKQEYSIESDTEIWVEIIQLQILLGRARVDTNNRMDTIEERIQRDNANVYKTIDEKLYLALGGGIIALIIILFVGILIGKKSR